MERLLIVRCDGLTDRELADLRRDLNDNDLVDEFLVCTDEQARAVRRAVDW